MNVSVHIPTALRSFTDRQSTVTVDADNVDGALQALTTTYSGLAKHLRDGQGKLRSFVNVYLGEEDIRYLDGEDTAVADGATLTIVPSIAGGTPR